MAVYELKYMQQIPAPIEKVWDFMTSHHNLQKITPNTMSFEITSEDLQEKVYPGMIITYTLKPLLGIKMNWVTEITQVRDLEYFVDDQRTGPYAMWHHQHWFERIEGGTLMTDLVHYIPPYGFIGAIANSLYIKSQLEDIFSYRRNKMGEIFGKFN